MAQMDAREGKAREGSDQAQSAKCSRSPARFLRWTRHHNINLWRLYLLKIEGHQGPSPIVLLSRQTCQILDRALCLLRVRISAPFFFERIYGTGELTSQQRRQIKKEDSTFSATPPPPRPAPRRPREQTPAPVLQKKLSSYKSSRPTHHTRSTSSRATSSSAERGVIEPKRSPNVTLTTSGTLSSASKARSMHSRTTRTLAAGGRPPSARTS